MDGNNMNNEFVNDVTEAVNEAVVEPAKDAADSAYTYVADNSYDYAAYDGEEVKPESNGLALASMILGIAGIVVFFLLICCSPFVGGIVALPVAIVGLVLGIKAKKKEQKKGMWLTGIICSAIALAIAVIVITIALVSLIGTLVLGGVSTMPAILDSMSY